MNTKTERSDEWPREIKLGRITVRVYRRKSPKGHICFQVANYATGDRRFDSYPNEAEAIVAAGKLARQMSECEVVAAAMTNAQASEYANAVQKLTPFNINLVSAANALAECLKLVEGLPDIQKACGYYQARHKRTTAKPVADVVKELIALKEQRGASARYLGDLRFRLGRIAEHFRKNTCDVSTADIQLWMDSQKLSPQSYKNFRTVLNLLFEYAVARQFASDNPVEGVERVKVRNIGGILIFTPDEITKLLKAATPDFLPCIAIGAFAGLRSAEIERLDWRDVDLESRHIVVGAGNAKTASRRIVPVAENLVEWLKPYAGRTGKVWQGTHDEFYDAQQDTAKTAGLKWKANALRHSCASYMFALSNDAGRIAGFLGNSASVIHRHYRELVKPADAQRWFEVKPEPLVNVLPMTKEVIAEMT